MASNEVRRFSIFCVLVLLIVRLFHPPKRTRRLYLPSKSVLVKARLARCSRASTIEPSRWWRSRRSTSRRPKMRSKTFNRRSWCSRSATVPLLPNTLAPISRFVFIENVDCDYLILPLFHPGHQAMDHNGIPGRRFGPRSYESWSIRGDAHRHHPARGAQRTRLSSFGAKASS